MIYENEHWGVMQINLLNATGLSNRSRAHDGGKSLKGAMHFRHF